MKNSTRGTKQGCTRRRFGVTTGTSDRGYNPLSERAGPKAVEPSKIEGSPIVNEIPAVVKWK